MTNGSNFGTAATELPVLEGAWVDFTWYGWGLLVAGHGHDGELLRRSYVHAAGPAGALRCEEMSLSVQRRVKRCGSYGDPCDMEGEWHTHYYPIRPNPASTGTEFTFIFEPSAAAERTPPAKA